jgi:hypothetical protein
MIINAVQTEEAGTGSGVDADEDVGVPSGNISAFSRTGCYVLEFSKSSAHHKLEIAHIESW